MSYAIGETESSTNSVTVNCPEGVECGALISKGYVKVTGKFYARRSDMCVEKSESGPFTAVRYKSLQNMLSTLLTSC